MLVLKRKEGQWVEITHVKTGEVLRIRTYDIHGGLPGHVNLAFDDPSRNYAIQRPEKLNRAEAPALPADAVVVEAPEPRAAFARFDPS